MNQSVTINVATAQEQAQEPVSPLKIWQKRLTVLLVLQVLLMIGVFAYQQNSRIQIDAQPLLGIITSDIDRIVIQDPSNKVSLQKSGNTWQLPELLQLPVDTQKLDDLLQKLDGTKLTWPVTTTASSHERFEVAEAKFQRRIELFQGENKKADIWLGTSPGFKKIHLRREGENQVYAVELTAFEFALEAKDWLQTDLLAVKDPAAVKGADYQLQKTGNDWSFVGFDSADSTEKVNAAKATELANAFASLQVQEPVSVAPQSEVIQAIVKSADGEFEYDFIKADSNYFVKRNDRDVYFKLSQSEFERITAINKAVLIAAPETTAPVDPLADMTSLDSVLTQ